MSDFHNMEGKTYLYNGNEHFIKAITESDDGKFLVVTDRTTIKLTKAEIKKELLPIAGENGKGAALEKYYKDETIQISSLATILMQEIEAIQKDPKRIEQARAISDTARTLIELKKTQIEIVKVMKGFSQ